MVYNVIGVYRWIFPKFSTELGKSDLNGEVTLLQGVICIVEYNLGLSQGDCNGEIVR